MKNFLHVNLLIHDFGLADVSRNAVEDENIDVRLEFVPIYRCIDRLLPQFNCDIIRDELTLAGVFQKRLANFGARIDRSEDITAWAMKKTGDAAECFALGAFAAARRAEEEVGVIFHGECCLYRTGRILPMPNFDLAKRQSQAA